ncbi:hypothetical protein [Candidatus Clostridium stratigraminis]|uniref:Uncharacterized protein n=1 Tax=Candidatus Clostridium stratigraminis TaxID=3381661 RepID=A0ABW8SYH9_9CLOT
MSYVDEDFYNGFSGLITDKLDSKLEKATDQINALTYNRIIGLGFENLTSFQQDKVKKAVCIHADFVEQYGEYINMPLSGFSAGSISVSFNAQKINGITTTQEVLNYLGQTGLTCRRL